MKDMEEFYWWKDVHVRSVNVATFFLPLRWMASCSCWTDLVNHQWTTLLIKSKKMWSPRGEIQLVDEIQVCDEIQVRRVLFWWLSIQILLYCIRCAFLFWELSVCGILQPHQKFLPCYLNNTVQNLKLCRVKTAAGITKFLKVIVTVNQCQTRSQPFSHPRDFPQAYQLSSV